MIVLAIISLIATLATPRLLDSFGRAKSQAARVQMENIKAALQIYYIDTGQYPSEAGGLQSLVNATEEVNNWNGPYLDEQTIKDPWGRKFIYHFPGSKADFDLLTFGRDGQPGGSGEDADIKL